MTSAESVNGTAQIPETNTPEAPETGGKRSTIRFPYTDIRDAVLIATRLKDNYGSECETDQLAALLKQKSSSGSFRTKTATAAVFGVIESRRGSFTLTDLGHRMADERGRPAALVEAFLQVPLYSTIYTLFKNKSLPGDTGLEAEIKKAGVLESQADRARQALMRSAEHAGFFWSGRDRLVMPPSAKIDVQDESPPPPEAGDEEESMADNPVLQGLWNMLPKNGEFPPEQRELWFRALAINLDLVYGAGQISITRVSNGCFPSRAEPREVQPAT